ncbi:MAG: type IV secretion system protein [Rhodobacter sp.]|nr:type IV secretion system protein [Rhodobacter sp.]
MSVVTFFVETAEGYLDTAAETQFGAVATTVGTMLVLGTTLVVALVFINMIYQYRAMDGRTAFWLAIKIGLIGIFATNWIQFNAISAAVLSGVDSIAGSLVASVGGGTPGPSGTFAEEFDQLIASLGDYLNAAGSEMNWMAGALLDTLGVLLLSILGGLAAFIVVASRLMIALLIGIAPIMIFLTLFEVTKDYFARWLSALVSFAMYPIVVAGVFATITGVSRALLAALGDPEGASNIGALIPFFMMVLMAKGFIIATPFIVRAVSGNIMMPALSAGFGGSYAFARGLAGSQQVYNRYAIGGATGAEYSALRARQLFGVQSLPARPNSGGGSTPAPANTSPSAGAQMLAQLARLSRLGRR